MSIKQITKVFEDEKLTPTRKLIMICIADNANDSGVCFPSFNTLMKKTNLSRPTINNNIKWLKENGYLFKKNRSRKNGGRSSNKYLIFPHQNRQLLDEEEYLIFEDLYSQSKATLLPTQSKVALLGEDTQSKVALLECEPSLILSNRHSKKNKQKKKTEFEIFIERVEASFKENKILTHRSKINKTKDTKEAFSRFDIVSSDLHERYAQYVLKNETSSARLDKWLTAVFEGREEAIEHKQQFQPTTKQETLSEKVARLNQEDNYTDVEVL